MSRTSAQGVEILQDMVTKPVAGLSQLGAEGALNRPCSEWLQQTPLKRPDSPCSSERMHELRSQQTILAVG